MKLLLAGALFLVMSSCGDGNKTEETNTTTTDTMSTVPPVTTPPMDTMVRDNTNAGGTATDTTSRMGMDSMR